MSCKGWEAEKEPWGQGAVGGDGEGEYQGVEDRGGVLGVRGMDRGALGSGEGGVIGGERRILPLGPPPAAPAVIVDRVNRNGASWDIGESFPTGFMPAEQAHMTATETTQNQLDRILDGRG